MCAKKLELAAPRLVEKADLCELARFLLPSLCHQWLLGLHVDLWFLSANELSLIQLFVVLWATLRLIGRGWAQFVLLWDLDAGQRTTDFVVGFAAVAAAFA